MIYGDGLSYGIIAYLNTPKLMSVFTILIDVIECSLNFVFLFRESDSVDYKFCSE